MKQAYLIMAHGQPELLKILLESLDCRDNDIFVHLDRKSSLSPADFINCVRKAELIFTKRLSVNWGGV